MTWKRVGETRLPNTGSARASQPLPLQTELCAQKPRPPARPPALRPSIAARTAARTLLGSSLVLGGPLLPACSLGSGRQEPVRVCGSTGWQAPPPPLLRRLGRGGHAGLPQLGHMRSPTVTFNPHSWPGPGLLGANHVPSIKRPGWVHRSVYYLLQSITACVAWNRPGQARRRKLDFPDPRTGLSPCEWGTRTVSSASITEQRSREINTNAQLGQGRPIHYSIFCQETDELGL